MESERQPQTVGPHALSSLSALPGICSDLDTEREEARIKAETCPQPIALGREIKAS